MFYLELSKVMTNKLVRKAIEYTNKRWKVNSFS
jgi:hypothetical protein